MVESTVMASRHAEIFAQLRQDVLETLVNSRSSIDDVFDSLAEEDIRRHFESVLDHMQKYIATAPGTDPGTHLKSSVSQWVAMLLGMGLSHRSALRTIVSLGDYTVQVARQKLDPGPDTNLYVLDLVRLNFNAARCVVTVFDDELRDHQG
jgi:hypothetical protein